MVVWRCTDIYSGVNFFFLRETTPKRFYGILFKSWDTTPQRDLIPSIVCMGAGRGVFRGCGEKGFYAAVWQKQVE